MLSFTAPKGWEMPTDAKPGEPFQAVGTFIADKDGNITMNEIDGSPLADGANDDESQETQPDDEEAEGEEKPEPGETGIDSMMKRAAKMGALGKM